MTSLIQCPTCAQSISAAAVACPGCGHPMNTPATDREDDVRKGITNAKFNEERANVLYGEIAIIAIGVGIGSQSWWIFGATVLGLFITLAIPALTIALAILLSIGWGLIGYNIGNAFSDGMAAPLVLGAIGLLCGAGTHWAALEWHHDID